MSTRIHLLSSPTPVPLGGDVEAACGRVVRKAEAIEQWEDAEMGISIYWMMSCCRKCEKKVNLRGRYWYAIQSGQSEHDARHGSKRRHIMNHDSRGKRIPISAAERIADEYGYDQVIIVARAIGNCEHVTTYGKTKEHCAIAARIGDYLKYKVMGWEKAEPQGMIGGIAPAQSSGRPKSGELRAEGEITND